MGVNFKTFIRTKDMKSKDYWEKYEEIDILKISAKFYKLNTIKIIESFNPKVILDYGSGSGEIALQLKNEKNNIICYEPIPHMFNKLKSNLCEDFFLINDLKNINRKIDMVIINSVLQYVEKKQFEDDLKEIKSKVLIISDIIPYDYSRWFDLYHSLKFSLKNKFLTLYCIHVYKQIFTNFSFHYNPKYTKYSKDEIVFILNKLGYQVKFVDNLGINFRRFSLIAYK